MTWEVESAQTLPKPLEKTKKIAPTTQISGYAPENPRPNIPLLFSECRGFCLAFKWEMGTQLL